MSGYRSLQRRRLTSNFFTATNAIVLSVFVLAGCVPASIKPQSKLTQPEELQAGRAFGGAKISAADWPSQNWWEAYGDAQLNALVEEALADSPDLRAAAARVRAAEAVVGAQSAALWPDVTGSVSSSRGRTPRYSTYPPPAAGVWSRLNEAKISGSYELDFWGKNHAAVEAALGRAKASEVERYAARLTLASSIVQAYINLYQYQDELDIRRRLLKTEEDVLDLTHRRVVAELDSQIDVKQAQAAIPANRAQIAAVEESLELTRNQIAMLLGKGPDRGLSIEPARLKAAETVSIPSALPADLLGRRPDVVAQRWQVEAAGRDIDVAKAEYYPNVNLSAFFGLQAVRGWKYFFRRQSYEFGFGPALSLPIFDGGRLDANLSSSDAAYDLAVENYNQTLTAALQDIADQLTSIRWLRERLDQQQQAVQTARDAMDLTRKRYAAGLATYLQVLSTQSDVFNQQLQLSALQVRGLALQADLSRALGGGYVPELSVREPIAASNDREQNHER